VHRLHRHFEDYVQNADSVEFCYSRDLQVLLEYREWRNFSNVIDKAKDSCQTAKQKILDHFVDVNKKVTLWSGSQREIADIMLTRYACYLIAQNRDPRKEEIAFAQSYFAVQTRKQETIEEHIHLAERLKMRQRLGMLKNRPLADFLPTVTITAKNLATEITNFTVAKEALYGERAISVEHGERRHGGRPR